LFVQLDWLVESTNKRNQSKRRTSDVDQALLRSDHVHDCFAHEVQLKQQLVQDFSLGIPIYSVSLCEHAEDTVQVFEVAQVNSCRWIVDQKQQAVDNEVLSDDALLSQVDIQDSIDHDLDSTDTCTHVWLALAQSQDGINCIFAQLSVFWVLCNTGNRLPQHVWEAVWIFGEPTHDQLEALSSFLNHLCVFVFSLEDKRYEHIDFQI